MVDLSKAKAGDTVKFRNGGVAVIGSIKYSETIPHELYIVRFKEWDFREFHFSKKGEFAHFYIFDITEVIPAPEVFDWSTVKVGDGFRYNVEGYDVVQYVGIHPSSKDKLFTAERYIHAFPIDTGLLTRSPEHDIKESV